MPKLTPVRSLRKTKLSKEQKKGYRTPSYKNLNKSAYATMRRIRKEEDKKLEKPVKLPAGTSIPRTNFGGYGKDLNMRTSKPAAKINPTVKSLWNDHKDKLVDWYHQALARAVPDVLLTMPEKITLNCTCEKRTHKVACFMLHSLKEIDVEYCSCRPLVEVLFMMHFVPSGAMTPNVAVHFEVLEWLHTFKMKGFVSNHSFADSYNGINKFGRSLGKTVLNNVYFIYRLIVNHSTGLLNQLYNLEECNCYACHSAPIKMVTMDGNFQLKRKSQKNDHVDEFDNQGVVMPCPVEKALWGSSDEVELFVSPKEVEKDCVSESLLDNNFKALTSTSRYANSRRFDENGVFSMNCARHGIPERLYDIRGGEGLKYAFACINHALQSQPSQFYFMYDIACKCKNQLEVEFPDLLDMNYRSAVTAFHAYAHTGSCQVKYNPKFIEGFGETDGEGCERVWSYLNNFVSMTRSMKRRTRKLVITDAIANFKKDKMISMAQNIQKKIVKTENKINALTPIITDEKSVQLGQRWNTIRNALCVPATDKFINNLKDRFRNSIDNRDAAYWSFVNAEIYISRAGTNHPLLAKVKKILQEKQKEYKDSCGGMALRELEEERKAAIDSVVNEEIVVFLDSVLDCYVSSLLMYEKKLNKGGLGTAKAGKLVEAIKKIKDNAEKIRAKLESHLSFITDEATKQKYTPPENINKLVQMKRQYTEEVSTSLDHDLLDYHQLNRAKEEIVMLKDEAKRFVENVKKDEVAIAQAIKKIEKGKMPESVTATRGHLVLLQKKYDNIKLIQKKIKIYLNEYRERGQGGSTKEAEDEIEDESDDENEDEDIRVEELSDVEEEITYE